MKQGNSYIKDTGDFLEKLKAIGEVPKGAILITADVKGNQYDKRIHKTVPKEDI